ncbi:MAG: NAD-dependent epimerase/dehydratase family protein [Acidobacteriota bacterium]
MRIFVTGAGGFVGRHLVRHLRARGHVVSGSFVGVRPEHLEIELFEADVLAPAALAEAFQTATPDAIVHLAGLSHVGESWQRPGEYFQVNVQGTENVLNAAAGLRLLLASSAEVYGPVPEAEQPLREDRQVDPRTPYALTKSAAELLALRRGATVARVFNLIGPGQSPTFALPAFAAQLAAIRSVERDPVLRVGNLAARRDFVHVEDGAAGLALLVEKGRRGEIYNLALGASRSIAEALDSLLVIAGVPARVEVDPERMRPLDNPLLCGDSSRSRALGWTPGHSVEDALKDLWQSVAPRG